MRHLLTNQPFRYLRAGSCLLLAGVGLGLSGCDDLIEPDISGDKVALSSPVDGLHSTTLVQTFQWAAVAHALSYRMEVATPSFANPTRLVLDSVVTHPTLTKSLVPATYEWRVQAVNAGYQTAFSSRQLTIDSSTGLNGQVVQLLQPATGYVTNGTNVTFGWSVLPMAQQYRLAVTPNPRGASLAPLDTLLTSAAMVTLRTARQSQTYQWKVTALDATSQAVSATQSFEVDVTAPAAPTLVTPTASASFLTLPISLNWTRAAGDVTQDSVFIYKADQTTLFAGFPRLNSGATLTLTTNSTPLISGTYYWAVRSVDKAGNVGPVSAKRAFILQ